jgi:hypothetical protein
VSEGVSEQTAKSIAARKKSDMAEAAEILLSGKGCFWRCRAKRRINPQRRAAQGSPDQGVFNIALACVRASWKRKPDAGDQSKVDRRQRNGVKHGRAILATFGP